MKNLPPISAKYCEGNEPDNFTVIAALHVMTNHCAKFDSEGFLTIPNVLNSSKLEELIEHCDEIQVSSAGSRNLLSFEWVRQLAYQVTQHQVIGTLLPKDVVTIQCNYFVKSLAKNWLVPLHRDLSIPVKRKFTAAGWSGWSEKEGILYT